MPSQSHVLNVLRQRGISVQPLPPSPTSSKKEADFLAEVDNEKILIEEKVKADSPEAMTERDKALSTGEVYSKTTEMAYSNPVSGIIHYAAKQLKSSSDKDPDFRLIWITASGSEAEADCENVRTTLYGIAHLITVDPPHIGSYCYFFSDSEFYRESKTIDGAIIGIDFANFIGFRLCLNPYSEKYKDLKNSKFVRTLGIEIEDPYYAEAQGLALIMDGPTNRKNKQECLDYLQQKYSCRALTVMTWFWSSATIAHPKGDNYPWKETRS